MKMNNCHITLLNLNMLYVRYKNSVDKELHVPLGCLYLVSSLEKAGYRVDFRDYQLNNFEEPFDAENIIKYLENSAPIVGFSTMANLLPFVILAIKKFKEIYPEKIVILGGVGAKGVEEKVLANFPWIDIIVTSEAENTIVEIVSVLNENKNIDLLSKVKGIYFRASDGRIVKTEKRERIKNLDTIPFPAFHKVDLKLYEGYGLMSTRGCPYKCSFCSVAPVWDHVSTFRSVDNILDEMRYLHYNAGVKVFLFQDEFFVCNKIRVINFCKKLKASGMKIFWKSFGRVDIVDTEMMEIMADSGCVEIRFGIESGSEKILQKVKKGFTPEQAINCLSQAIKIFPRVDAFYIWGFPFETMEDFYQSVFQMVMFRNMGVRILPSLLCLLPQTELYHDLVNSQQLKLEFCPYLFPEYMITGHEISNSSSFEILPSHKKIYDFIQKYPDIFPGFFHINLTENVLPKFQILKKFGFYLENERKEENTESCGAHSPKI